jgi:hypothetical protein
VKEREKSPSEDVSSVLAELLELARRLREELPLEGVEPASPVPDWQ